jgi:hypothetical protein
MNNKLKPALVGGVALFVLGLLTSICTSLMPPSLGRIAGCCNCLWPIGGGLLAAYLYIKNSQSPVQIGEGAALGALAGVIGGVLNLIIGTPIAYIMSRGVMDQMAAQFEQAGINLPAGLIGFPLLILFGIIGIVLYTILATIGGLIGVPLFEKRKGGAGVPPPPPPNFGGQAGGGFGAGS